MKYLNSELDANHKLQKYAKRTCLPLCCIPSLSKGSFVGLFLVLMSSQDLICTRQQSKCSYLSYYFIFLLLFSLTSLAVTHLQKLKIKYYIVLAWRRLFCIIIDSLKTCLQYDVISPFHAACSRQDIFYSHQSARFHDT